jgi:hypothetical protein
MKVSQDPEQANWVANAAADLPRVLSDNDVLLESGSTAPGGTGTESGLRVRGRSRKGM